MQNARPLLPTWLSVLLGAVLLLWLMERLGGAITGLSGVLGPVFFAFLIAYLLDPVVDWLEARKVPRALGITLLLLAATVAIGVLVIVVVPDLIRDLRDVARELPGKLVEWLRRLEPMLAEYGVTLPHSLEEALAQANVDTDRAPELAGRAMAPLRAIGGFIVGGTASAMSAVVAAMMAPVLAFYLLYDFDRMMAAARTLIPERHRASVVDLAREVDRSFNLFIRGQITVMLILAVLYSVAYSLAGVRFAVLIGIVAGVLSFIPYVGGAAALLLALLMSALGGADLMQYVWVGVGYAIIQLAEGFVITPRIVGDKLGLSSLWVMLALMVGGELFGFLGVLLALPAAAVIKVLMARGLRQYQESALYWR